MVISDTWSILAGPDVDHISGTQCISNLFEKNYFYEKGSKSEIKNDRPKKSIPFLLKKGIDLIVYFSDHLLCLSNMTALLVGQNYQWRGCKNRAICYWKTRNDII